MTIDRSPDQPFLVLDTISKSFPGVAALTQVSLSVAPGEVLALIGENGAGKSTLMKILGGVLAPSSGRIRIDGVDYPRLSVEQSQAAGIAFVHQELNVFDNLDAAANIFLGRELRSGPLGLVDTRAMRDAAEPLLRRIGASFSPDAPVARLSLAERQLLEIAKALSIDARVVIMDEPTSSLTIKETGVLLRVIGELKAAGIAVIYISHRLGEVQECAERVVVLRDGRVAGQLTGNQIEHEAMIRLMIGRDLKALYTPPAHPVGDVVLSIRDVANDAHPNARASIEVRAGEILGVAGLVGAGRTELAETIFGITPIRHGSVWLDGRPLDTSSPCAVIAAGLYLIPEDRKRTGLVLESSICENISMADLGTLSRAGMVSSRAMDARAEQQRRALGIKTADIWRKAAELSGGNQQKVVLGKWLSMRPRMVIFDEPTRGIDVGAKAEIYLLMRGLADAGVGVMMISSDMEEVIGVSDRIIVMREGAVSGTLERPDFSEHNVLQLAVGAN